MNKLQQKIKSLLREIKEQQENRYWYVATITFSTEYFFRRVNSVSDFYKRLSNSKTGLVGHPSNREWWSKLSPSGFYDFSPNKDIHRTSGCKFSLLIAAKTLQKTLVLRRDRGAEGGE